MFSKIVDVAEVVLHPVDVSEDISVDQSVEDPAKKLKAEEQEERRKKPTIKEGTLNRYFFYCSVDLNMFMERKSPDVRFLSLKIKLWFKRRLRESQQQILLTSLSPTRRRNVIQNLRKWPRVCRKIHQHRTLR